jgi:hypothetical protein
VQAARGRNGERDVEFDQTVPLVFTNRFMISVRVNLFNQSHRSAGVELSGITRRQTYDKGKVAGWTILAQMFP